MSDLASVDSIDTLRDFRAQLWKFAEVANVALADAEAELSRTLMWLESEQTVYWATQIRKRTELVNRAAAKLHEKRVFKDASGRTPSAVDEEKALRLANARLEAAQEKAAATKKYIRVLQKASDDYKGAVQAMSSFVAYDLPRGVARLDKLTGILERYVDLGPPTEGAVAYPAGAVGSGPESTAAMARTPDPASANTAPAATTPAENLPDFPVFEPPHVVLVHTHKPSGLILAADGRSVADEGNQYRRFGGLADAQEYARRKVETEPMIECVIYDAARIRQQARDEG